MRFPRKPRPKPSLCWTHGFPGCREGAGPAHRDENRRGFRMHPLSGGAPSVCLAASNRRKQLDRGLCLSPFLVQAFCVFALASALANYVRQRHSSGAAVRSGDIARALLPTFLGAPGRALNPDWWETAARERLRADPIRVEAGHAPHVSQPVALATILDSLAKS